MTQQNALDSGLDLLLRTGPNDRGWRSRLGRSESTGYVFQATLSPDGGVTIDGPLPRETGHPIITRRQLIEIPDDTYWGSLN